MNCGFLQLNFFILTIDNIYIQKEDKLLKIMVRIIISLYYKFKITNDFMILCNII